MKKLFCLGLILVICLSSSGQKKSPVIGVWKSTMIPTNGWSGSNIKMWTETYCTYVGEFRKDTMIYNVFGGGPYILNGTRCEETIEYNQNKNSIGHTYKMIYEIKGDTLYQYYPVNDNWEYDIKTCNIDKYVRIK